MRPSLLLLRSCIKFSEAGADLGLWDLKSLRFEQVDRNPISWQSLSLEPQHWPSSVSAAEAPGAAAAPQLCTWKGRTAAPWLLLPSLEDLSRCSIPKNYHGETGKCQRAHCSETEAEGVEGSGCSGGAGGAAVAMLRSQAGDIRCCLLLKTFDPE